MEVLGSQIEERHMKKLAMIGTQIIHTYPYLAYFNGFVPELVQKNAKPWMAVMLNVKAS